MLARINQAPVIEDYTTQRAEGGVIEESAGVGDIPKEGLDVVMNRLHANGALWAPRVHPEIAMNERYKIALSTTVSASPTVGGLV